MNNEEEVIYLEDVKEERRSKVNFEDLKKIGKSKIDKVIDFGIKHKEAILVLAPVVISGTIEVVKIIAKRSNLKAEEHLKDDYIYDSKCRHYYELNKSPKNSEWVSIDERTSNGELLGHVLRDMRFID